MLKQRNKQTQASTETVHRVETNKRNTARTNRCREPHGFHGKMKVYVCAFANLQKLGFYQFEKCGGQRAIFFMLREPSVISKKRNLIGDIVVLLV